MTCAPPTPPFHSHAQWRLGARAPRLPAASRLLELGALVIALFVVSVAIPGAMAGDIPADGPRLFGKVMPDKTLLGLWTYGMDGSPTFVGDYSLLQSDALHVITFVPVAEIHDGQIELSFTWYQEVKGANQTAGPNGVVSTVPTVTWEETASRTFQVEASSSRLHDTALDLPTQKDPRRLVIVYNNRTVAEITHHTSPIFVKTPRQVLQEKYLESATLLVFALGASIAGLLASRTIYRRAGNYVPELSPRFWALSLIVLTFVGAWLWFSAREGLILKGAMPPLITFAVLVCFLSLQIWREDPARFLFLRIVDTMDATQPQTHVWTRYVPTSASDDEGALSDDPRDHPWVEDTWKATFWRLLGARTYLRFPESSKWYYEVTGNPNYRRLYLLKDDVLTTQRPHITWERPEGAWLPRMHFHKLCITEVPVSPWAADRMVMKVLAGIVAQSHAADEHQKLLVRNAELEAALRAGVVLRARKLLDHLLLALRAVRTGGTLDVALDEHETLKQATDPKPPAGAGHNDGPGGSPAASTPVHVAEGPTAPEPARRAP